MYCNLKVNNAIRDYTELLHLASDYVCPNSVTGIELDRWIVG